jgi:hypothetical protein
MFYCRVSVEMTSEHGVAQHMSYRTTVPVLHAAYDEMLIKLKDLKCKYVSHNITEIVEVAAATQAPYRSPLVIQNGKLPKVVPTQPAETHWYENSRNITVVDGAQIAVKKEWDANA